MSCRTEEEEDVTVSQNFATIMHPWPFAVTKEWMKGLDDKDRIRLNCRVSKLKNESVHINSNARFFGRASIGMKKAIYH